MFSNQKSEGPLLEKGQENDAHIVSVCSGNTEKHCYFDEFSDIF